MILLPLLLNGTITSWTGKEPFELSALQEILAQKQAAIAALRRDVARECKVGGPGVCRVELRLKEIEVTIRECAA